MKLIRLTKGTYASVDVEDYPKVAPYSWHKHNGGYATAWVDIDGTRKKVLMHRFILDAPSGVQCDHINGDRLDNRRQNLRLATHGENQFNRSPRKEHRYKGIHYFARDGRYQVSIRKDNRQFHLGYWDTAEEAARAYDQAAVFLFGEFARTNFPVDPSMPREMPAWPKRRHGSKPKTFRSDTHRECAICHEVKPRGEFPPGPKLPGSDPNDTRCRICNNIRRSRYRKPRGG